MKAVPVKSRAKEVKELDTDSRDLPNERALGVYWHVSSDKLGFKINQQKHSSTRRGILSVVSSVFDPLGFVSPFILKAKILLQNMCQRKIGLDDELEESDLKRWNQWLAELGDIKKLEIDRCYKAFTTDKIVHCKLHNFFLMLVIRDMQQFHIFAALIPKEIYLVPL